MPDPGMRSFSVQAKAFSPEVSGFIRRDFAYRFDGKRSRLSRYRIKDNYLRFYLRYIDPIKDKIRQGLFRYTRIENLQNWGGIMGL